MKVMMTKANSKSFLLTDIYKGSQVVTAQKLSKLNKHYDFFSFISMPAAR